METTTEQRTDFEPVEQRGESRRQRARGYFREHPNAKWVLLLVALALAAGVLFAWRYYSVRESTDDAQIDGHIIPLSSRVSGTVVAVNVEDNQFVEKGTVLVQLDQTDYRVAIQKAEADLADARAGAAAASTGIPIARSTFNSQLANAQAALATAQEQATAAAAAQRQAEANHHRIAADVQRFSALVAKDEIPRQQYDTAVAQEQAAAAAVDSAKAQLAAANSRVAEARAGLGGAQTAPQQIQVTQSRAGSATAAVARAQAALDQAKLNMQYTTIVASQPGIISKRNVEPGQVIQAGQPLFAIVYLDDIWVTANFKETQLKKMKAGDPTTIHVDAYDRDYNGHIDSIGGATGARFSLLPPENATGNYVKVVQRVPVKIVFDKGQDPNHTLRPGMSAVPTVKVGK
jgi:membrane fusion protein (multidrug efflux system)